MFCKHCGKELRNGEKCPNCATQEAITDNHAPSPQDGKFISHFFEWHQNDKLFKIGLKLRKAALPVSLGLAATVLASFFYVLFALESQSGPGVSSKLYIAVIAVFYISVSVSFLILPQCLGLFLMVFSHIKAIKDEAPNAKSLFSELNTSPSRDVLSESAWAAVFSKYDRTAFVCFLVYNTVTSLAFPAAMFFTPLIVLPIANTNPLLISVVSIIVFAPAIISIFVLYYKYKPAKKRLMKKYNSGELQ